MSYCGKLKEFNFALFLKLKIKHRKEKKKPKISIINISWENNRVPFQSGVLFHLGEWDSIFQSMQKPRFCLFTTREIYGTLLNRAPKNKAVHDEM